MRHSARTLLSTLALALLAPVASSLAAQHGAPGNAADTPEGKEVLATIIRFTDALRTRDTAAMLQLIDTAATRMTLLRPAPGGGVRVVALSGRQFITLATNPNNPPIDEPIRNPVVQIDGHLATVWAEYQVRRPDRTVSHCGFDAFHVAKLNGSWKLLNVSDTFRQQGCGPAWP